MWSLPPAWCTLRQGATPNSISLDQDITLAGEGGSVTINTLVVPAGVDLEVTGDVQVTNLTNNGSVKETKTIGASGAYVYALCGVQTNVATQGTLSALSVKCINAHHPQALSTNMQTGRWWEILATGAGFTVDLTLPHDNLAAPNVCKYTGTGVGGYDCSLSSFTTSTVTRMGIQAFSEWTVGDNVGPTAVSLQSLDARSTGLSWLLVAALALLDLAGLVLLRRRMFKN